MKVFVTGGTGYIGGVIIERLQEAGHEVTGLARSEESAQKLAERGVSPLRGSISDLEVLRTATRVSDAVIHTAIEFTPEGFEAEYAAVEVMLDELEGTGRSLLFTSGVGVLGSGKAELLDEESAYAPWPLVARRVATEEAVIASASRGVHSAVIRPGMVYGRSGGNGIGLYLEGAARLGVAPYLDDGDALWPMVHVDDLADLYLLALQGAAPGAIVHGVMPGAVRFREIAEAAVGGLHLAGGSISWSAEQFLEAFGPAAPVLLVDQRLAPSRALEELAWRPSRPDLLYELVRGGYDGQGCSGARRLG